MNHLKDQIKKNPKMLQNLTDAKQYDHYSPSTAEKGA